LSRREGLNVKFVVRGFIIALPLTVLAVIVGVVLIVAQTPIGQPPGPTPLPPTILAPRGEMPAGPVGLQEWAKYRDGWAGPGSGFLILLESGEIVGVTTAHSVLLDDPGRPLERIALRVPGQADDVAGFDTLRGQPGQALEGYDMTMDYLLLHTDQPVDPDLVLRPDPRGAPQPGERVWLFSGQGNAGGDRRILEGTVQSAGDTAVWVLMDELFQPGLMSGSPMVSQHTGQAVGMVIAVTLRRNRLLMGVHPIGSIVQLAESATGFVRIDEYQSPIGSPTATEAAVGQVSENPTPVPTATATATSMPSATPSSTPTGTPTAAPPLTPTLQSTSTPALTSTSTPTETFAVAAAEGPAPGLDEGVRLHPEVAPVVLANYFPWYDPETWSTGCTSGGDLPRDGVYQSDDPGVIARHIAQAQGAGLDGFAVHWFAAGDRTDSNFAQVLGQSQDGFNSTVTFLYHILPGVDRQGVIDALHHVIDGYSGHPRFFRAGGKPVIMFSDLYRVPGAGGSHAAAIEIWRQVRNAVDPHHATWWIAEGLEPAYLAVFDGLFVYKIDHACCPNACASASRWAGWTRDWEGQTGQPKLWVGTVMPGWNDLNTGQAHCVDLRVSSEPFARDRAGGAYYARTWEAVLPTQPDFVVLHSFNEWVEGSYVEPSAAFGDLYLQLTAQWIAQFKGDQQ
jgi:hypothetical protein